jgi:hypothetical protein
MTMPRMIPWNFSFSSHTQKKSHLTEDFPVQSSGTKMLQNATVSVNPCDSSFCCQRAWMTFQRIDHKVPLSIDMFGSQIDIYNFFFTNVRSQMVPCKRGTGTGFAESKIWGYACEGLTLKGSSATLLSNRNTDVCTYMHCMPWLVPRMMTM